MDSTILHQAGKILMTIGALSFIISGTILINRQQNDEKKQQTKNQGTTFISIGLSWLVIALVLF